MASSLYPGQKKLLLVVAATATLILRHSTVTDGAGDSSLAKPDCQDKCGNVRIPYPFGIGKKGCFLHEGFEVICENDQAYLSASTANYSITMSPMKILEINLLRGEARVQSPIAWHCNYSTGATDIRNPPTLFEVGPLFTISETKSKFTAIGCATFVYVIGDNSNFHSSCACGSFCLDEHSMDNITQCTGIGCCQTTIPAGLGMFLFYLDFSDEDYNTQVWDFSPCSYGFVVEEDWFKLNPSYAKSSYFLEHYRDGVPLVLDWVADSKTCLEATKNQSSYACRDLNSVCNDTLNGPGYYCSCSQGYEGNPYLEGSCQDINECDFPSVYPCNGKCKNTKGSYTCSCPPGTQSSDPKNSPCTASRKTFIGISISLICLIVCTFTLIITCQKRKLAKEKERFFRQNGGHILYRQILSRQVDTVTLFTIEVLKAATDNFDKSREIGIGGHGTVYKGILVDNRVVAVKRSKIINVTHTEEFVQEIIILSQINHRNVVRLLGCCLEVEVPILVYEFIPNGTLFQLIHGNHGRPPISLEARLKIAQESAEALSYLHLSTNHPIVHGDVKSLNILLDEKYMAKVTDFGASRILPNDAIQLMTMVQGTLGYLDPEYLQERKLTEKSDVYSFGVVLLELITRKTAISMEGPDGGQRNLATSFLKALEENSVRGILDTSIMGVGMELLQEVVELARLCLSFRGVERPSMAQVADKLKAIRSTWREILLLQHKETERLVEGLDAASTSGLPPSMYWTAGMMGLDIETPRVDHIGTTPTN